MTKRTKFPIKHGHNRVGKRTRTYRAWVNMKTRMLNASAPTFAEYAPLGIGVCTRWLSFDNFLADMGECPDGLTLERRDNSKGYYPKNCKWDTPKNQANNRRSNHRITFQGETKTIAQWADALGISASALYHRIYRNWDIERMFTQPCRLQNGSARHADEKLS